MLTRSILVLFCSQLIFVSGAVLLATIGGIVGAEIAPSRSLATLPLSLMIVGAALTAVPASLLMQRTGRRRGFVFAALLAAAGATTAAYALEAASFALFCTGAASIGAAQAFSQQFRFAAAESVPADRVSYAVSFILLGSIGGAVLGPEFASRSQSFTPETPYRAGMVAMVGLYLLASTLLALLPRSEGNAKEDLHEMPRSLTAVVSQPLFVVALLAGIVGQGVMTFVMTATPVSMHVMDGHGIQETASVIRAHVIAMYLPSLASAPLIARFGTTRLMVAGVSAMLLSLGAGLMGQGVVHYWWALVLLGIGWNFLYVGGTTLLVRSYRASEKFRAQAVNEFSIFGISALSSLLAGTIVAQLGWSAVLVSCLPLLALMALALVLARARGLDAVSS